METPQIVSVLWQDKAVFDPENQLRKFVGETTV
jgi:hypothetical protein